jgi:hypothetical protein
MVVRRDQNGKRGAPGAWRMAGNVGHQDRHVNINLVRPGFDYFEGDRDPTN